LVPGESKKPSIVTHERFKELEAIKVKAASAWATAPQYGYKHQYTIEEKHRMWDQ